MSFSNTYLLITALVALAALNFMGVMALTQKILDAYLNVPNYWLFLPVALLADAIAFLVYIFRYMVRTNKLR